MARERCRQTYALHNFGRSDFTRDNETQNRRRTTNSLQERQTVEGRTHNHDHRKSLHQENAPGRQESSPKRYRHDSLFQEQVYEYKSGLVDRINKQMSIADSEVNQKMDDLSEHLNQSLGIIEQAAEPFRCGVPDERLQLDDGARGHKEVILSAVMANLEELMEAKSKRLKELAVEYARVHQRITALAIAVLGEDKVSFAEFLNGKDEAAKVGRYIQKDVKAAQTAQPQYEGMEQVYHDAETGLEELQSKLDDLVSENLAENKESLKAFHASRKSKQADISKLLASWSQS